MKLIRRIIDTAALVSLLLVILSTLVWVRSYRTAQMWTRGQNDLGADRWRRGTWQLATSRGSLAYRQDWSDTRGLSHIPPQDLADARRLLAVPEIRQPRRYLVKQNPLPTDRATFGLPTTLGFGFEFQSGRLPVASTGTSWALRVVVPYWALTAICGIPLAGRLWYGRRLRRRRGLLEAGHRPCPACGYDLRATPARCPECGAVPPPPPPPPA